VDGSHYGSVVGIDPTTGKQKFSVPMDLSGFASQPNYFSGNYTNPIIAGDGYAYVAYTYERYSGAYDVIHLMLLRVGSDGSSSKIDVHDWQSADIPGPFAFEAEFLPPITNADQGVVLSWLNVTSEGVFNGLATTSGGRLVSLVSTPTLIQPILQAQDGTFYGTNSNGMIKFDQSGKIYWSVPNDSPKIATADGGVIGSSGITYDSQGRATGQVSMPILSWTGHGYQYGSTVQVIPTPTNLATGFWPVFGANDSGNSTAANQQWYPALPSCPGEKTPCAYEALYSAMEGLKTRLQPGSCPKCDQFVFGILGRNQASLLQYLSLPFGFFDGTRSNLPLTELCGNAGGASGTYKWAWCWFWNSNSTTVSENMSGTSATTKTPSDAGEGMITFVDPKAICKTKAATPEGVRNEAMIFHESLHGFYGLRDLDLQKKFGLTQDLAETWNITAYLMDNVLGGGSTCAYGR